MMMEEIKECNHPSKYKSFTWTIKKFSEKFDIEFKYCFCQICNTSEYTGDYKYVERLNRITPSAKEQCMSKDKFSVSTSLKSRFVKEGKDMSLKQFARMLATKGDEMALRWFDNKHGACNAYRSEKNRVRVSLEKTATKSARRSKKGGKGVTTSATTTKTSK